MKRQEELVCSVDGFNDGGVFALNTPPCLAHRHPFMVPIIPHERHAAVHRYVAHRFFILRFPVRVWMHHLLYHRLGNVPLGDHEPDVPHSLTQLGLARHPLHFAPTAVHPHLVIARARFQTSLHVAPQNGN